MGMEQAVTFATGSLPSWDTIAALLAARGFPAQVRMIDGELAFPDEQPPEGWRELRLGTPQGMVTLRRGPDHITFVTWGNADRPLLQAWNALAWAYAHAGPGQVQTAGGPVTADEYRRTADLPPALGGGPGG